MKSKECFFSEIESRTGSCSSSEANCRVFFTPNDSKISVQIKQGMTFAVPLSHPVTNVFALPEGLLIETRALNPVSKDSLKNELLFQAKPEDSDGGGFQFSYFSLNFHPLNQLYSVKICQSGAGRAEEFGRESISKELSFAPKVNVFSSGFISSEFISDSQYVNRNVGGARRSNRPGKSPLHVPGTAGRGHVRLRAEVPPVLQCPPEHERAVQLAREGQLHRDDRAHQPEGPVLLQQAQAGQAHFGAEAGASGVGAVQSRFQMRAHGLSL